MEEKQGEEKKEDQPKEIVEGQLKNQNNCSIMETTPVPKAADYTCEGAGGVTYLITVTPTADSLSFVITKEGKLPRKRFEAKFNYEQLVQKAKWFALFESVTPIAVELCMLFEEKKFKIEEKPDKITLFILIKLRYIEELLIDIPNIEIKTEDILQDLYCSINQIRATLSTFSEKFDILERSPLYKKIFEKGELLKSNLPLPNSQFLEIIKQKISSQEVSFKLLYSTSIDGDSCAAFHSNCDQKGETLVVIRTAKNYVFGGYTNLNWDQSGSNKYDSRTFLFSFNLKKIYPSSGSGYSIYCSSSNGPTFGGSNGYDINIASNCFAYNSNSVAFFNYSNGSGSEMAGESNFTVKELEVYEVTTSTQNN